MTGVEKCYLIIKYNLEFRVFLNSTDQRFNANWCF